MDLNPFDGNGVDGGDAAKLAAAIASIALFRKGYTGLKVIGPETAQTYLRGTKATNSFLQTPRGSSLMKNLELPDSSMVPGYRKIVGDRRSITTEAGNQLRDANLIKAPEILNTFKYAPSAVINSGSTRGTVEGFDTYVDTRTFGQSLIDANSVLDQKTGSPVSNIKFDKSKHVIWIRPKPGVQSGSLNPSDYEAILVKKRAGVPLSEQKPLNPPVPIYGESSNFETNPIYNPSAALSKISKIAQSEPLSPEQAQKSLKDSQSISSIDLTQPAIAAGVVEDAIQQMALNKQVTDRYKGLGVYRNILEDKRSSGKKGIVARFSAQRDFNKVAKESTAERRALRDEILPSETIDQLSQDLSVSKFEATNRVKSAYATRTAKTTDKRAYELLQDDLKSITPILKRNKENSIDAAMGLDVLNPEPLPYIVNTKYVSKVGYIKQYPPTRPADFLPSRVGASQQNTSYRMIAEGESYPTVSMIKADEILAMNGLPPVEAATTSNVSKSRSLRRALQGQNEVVVDDSDIASMIVNLPRTREGFGNERMITNTFESPTGYEVMREAVRRAITQGASTQSGKDMFIEQALRDLRGIGGR